MYQWFAAIALFFALPAWAETGGVRCRFYLTQFPPLKFADYSDDGDKILTAARFRRSTPVVWDAKTGQKLFTLGHDLGHSCAQLGVTRFSKSGRYIATSCPGSPRRYTVWNAQSGHPISMATAYASDATKLKFNPAETEFVTPSGPGALLIDVETGKIRLRLKPKVRTGNSQDTTYSKDGKLLALATRAPKPGVFIFDTETGEQLGAYWRKADSGQRPADITKTLFVQPDERFLVARTENPSEVLLFDTHSTDLKPLKRLEAGDWQSLSPDGQRLLARMPNGSRNTIGEWDILSGDLISSFQLPSNHGSVVEPRMVIAGGQYVMLREVDKDSDARAFSIWRKPRGTGSALTRPQWVIDQKLFPPSVVLSDQKESRGPTLVFAKPSGDGKQMLVAIEEGHAGVFELVDRKEP